MKSTGRLIAIYDFEFFPYALGDVLTWNIRTAIRCEELGKDLVDIYLCLDERYPASIYQRGLVNPDNFDLFFSELYGAFGTNPRLGNIYIFRQRETMLAQLQKFSQEDENNLKAFQDYLKVMKYREVNGFLSKVLSRIKRTRIKTLIKKILNRLFPKNIKDAVCSNLSHEYALNNYFINYVYSHETINKFYEKNKRIPLLKPSLGCDPDVDEIIARKFKGKKIVPFHLRLRRLDVGYGGSHSYNRDSNFLEWYDFLREAGIRHPEVQFVALGRLQEKPLEILRLPNVTSLRLYGMGLGHELTLMLKSHLFIGSSSGFAALANFSLLPYFITRMNPGSCDAYAIPEGSDQLPFATDKQKLIYEEETSGLLMKLLERGLSLTESAVDSVVNSDTLESKVLNVHAWLKEHSNPHHSARTTYRFYHDDQFRQEETAYLLLPYIEEARKAFMSDKLEMVRAILVMLEQNFPMLCNQMPQYLILNACLASNVNDFSIMQDCLKKLELLALPEPLKKLTSVLKVNLASDQDKVSGMEKLKASIQELNFAACLEVV